MGELFPASGPVRTKIVGRKDADKTEQAQRVEEEMNYLLTEKMTEYRDETEQMLFRLPLAGSSFKKVYYDPLMERPAAMFVPAEDFVVSYGASDLATCPRYTHVMKKNANEIVELQVNGFYRDVELPDPEPDYSDIQEKYDEIEGESAVIEDDDRHTILEAHVDLNMPEPFDDTDGIARPYVVTLDKSSRIVLSVRRNWYDGDPKNVKDNTSSIIATYPASGFMERVLFISLAVLLRAPLLFFVSLLMLVRYQTSLLASRLGVFALKVMIRLSCRVSSATWTYRAVQSGILLHSFLTKNRPQSSINFLEISLKRGDGLAPLRMYKLETSIRKRR